MADPAGDETATYIKLTYGCASYSAILYTSAESVAFVTQQIASDNWR